MRALVLVLTFAACAAQRTAWTPIEPHELADTREGFVLMGLYALHISHVEVLDGHLHARVLRAWELPPVGAADIADDPRLSPEDIARRAGWQELRIANSRLDAPIAAIRSARAVVGVEDNPEDEDWNADEHPVVLAILGAALDVVLETYAHPQ